MEKMDLKFWCFLFCGEGYFRFRKSLRRREMSLEYKRPLVLVKFGKKKKKKMTETGD